MVLARAESSPVHLGAVRYGTLGWFSFSPALARLSAQFHLAPLSVRAGAGPADWLAQIKLAAGRDYKMICTNTRKRAAEMFITQFGLVFRAAAAATNRRRAQIDRSVAIER